MISIIVAVSDDWGIGKNNDLLWNLPGDMKRFRQLTMGNMVIMGKKTWESLPKKPLPGRTNVVITDIPGEKIDNAEVVYSIQEAASKCPENGEAFVIGGGSIYRQFLPLADRLYITHVHKTAPADIYFPEIDTRIWKEAYKEEHYAIESIPSYTYIIYEK